ncbi:MAG: uracil-DNA glycosylase [Bdellovibrionota bacterium]
MAKEPLHEFNAKKTVASSWDKFLPPRAIIMGRQKNVREVKTENLTNVQTREQTNNHDNYMTKDLGSLRTETDGCTRCKLCKERNSVVFGEGNPNATLMFVGEGPGEQEDLQGRPFVGRAGQLLDRMIGAIGLKRTDVYIANVVKCRPPGNRNPELDEITACSPFLHRQLDIIKPKVVMALGKFAAQTLLQTEERISLLRGRFHQYRGAKLMPTFHPAYLLRNPSSKREAWADLQLVAAELGLAVSKTQV